MWPFKSSTTTTDDDHTINKNELEVLYGGDTAHQYTAGEALSARQAVTYAGNYRVKPTDSITDLQGVALYDAASGDLVALAEGISEVMVPYEGDLELDRGVRLADSMTWVQDDDYREIATAREFVEDCEDELVRVVLGPSVG